MRSNEFSKMDLIIGPVYNSTLRTAAPFSKQKRIPLISPLSPADQLVVEHPYFIMATNKKIIFFIKLNAQSTNIIVHSCRVYLCLLFISRDVPVI